jgi:antitoxin component YwqK of YwqJK toxin-antitoxin module
MKQKKLNPSDIANILEIEYVEKENTIVYLQFDYLLKDGRVIETKPMGSLQPGDKVENFLLEGDEIKDILSSREADELRFLKLVTLRKGNVLSMGHDVYKDFHEDRSFRLAVYEKVTCVRACFKKTRVFSDGQERGKGVMIVRGLELYRVLSQN